MTKPVKRLYGAQRKTHCRSRHRFDEGLHAHAAVSESGLEPIGFGVAESKGVKKGAVVNLEADVESIKKKRQRSGKPWPAAKSRPFTSDWRLRTSEASIAAASRRSPREAVRSTATMSAASSRLLVRWRCRRIARSFTSCRRNLRSTINAASAIR